MSTSSDTAVKAVWMSCARNVEAVSHTYSLRCVRAFTCLSLVAVCVVVCGIVCCSVYVSTASPDPYLQIVLNTPGNFNSEEERSEVMQVERSTRSGTTLEFRLSTFDRARTCNNSSGRASAQGRARPTIILCIFRRRFSRRMVVSSWWREGTTRRELQTKEKEGGCRRQGSSRVGQSA